MSSSIGISRGIYKNGLARRVVRWMDAMAHPPLAIEIAHDRIAGVRWTRHGHIADLAIEALPSASIVPSALETNMSDVKAVADAFSKIATRLKASDEDVALLLPDSVIRVFIQHFDEFPRSAQQALPLLRWKLKKSVPFPAEEMLISYTVQPSRESGVDVVAALSRDRIIRAKSLRSWLASPTRFLPPPSCATAFCAVIAARNCP